MLTPSMSEFKHLSEDLLSHAYFLLVLLSSNLNEALIHPPIANFSVALAAENHREIRPIPSCNHEL